jgi:hypothetical protein
MDTISYVGNRHSPKAEARNFKTECLWCCFHLPIKRLSVVLINMFAYANKNREGVLKRSGSISFETNS